MAELSFNILGCGSSGGVPRLGGNWGDCDPNNSKNERSRCSLLVELTNTGGVTRVLIDTSPDMRNQLLKANVGRLDGVVYTHGHADHIHGIDDLRMVFYNMRKRVNVWADTKTQKASHHLLPEKKKEEGDPKDNDHESLLDDEVEKSGVF